MKSMWIALRLMRWAILVADRIGIGIAERDVARRVLVEQRVEEDGARLPMRPSPSTSATSPRREAPSSFAQRVPQRLRAVVGLDLDRASALEADAEVRDDRAADVERLRCRDDAVRARRIGRREDLLGRQVRVMDDPVDRRACRASPDAKCDVGSRPTVRSVPGPLKRSASKRASSSLRPASCSCASRRRHAAAGVGLVEPQHEDELSQSRASAVVVVELGMDDSRPLGRRPGNDAPVRRLGVDHLEDAPRARAAGRGRRAPGRCRRAARAACCGVIEMREPCAFPRSSRRCAVPRRHELERVLGGVLGADPLDVRVEVPGIDEDARRARSTRPRPHGQAAPTSGRDDPGHLPGLDVGAELDDQRRRSGRGARRPRRLTVQDRCCVRPAQIAYAATRTAPLTRSSEAGKESNVAPCRHPGAQHPARRGADRAGRSPGSRTRSSSATTTSRRSRSSASTRAASRSRSACAASSRSARGVELALGQLDITFHRDDVHVRDGRAPRRAQPLVRDTKLDFELEGAR